MTNKDKFPIKTATACQFKWTWSTLFLIKGTSSSCHRCWNWDVSEHMQDFHNHPGKIADREKMLNGEWCGNGCEYCKKIEDAGGVSERNGYINDLYFSPKELIENPNATSVSPRILEVYFTNLCNQKCVYCSPMFSNLIQLEIEKYGPLEREFDLVGFNPRDDYDKLKNDFWIWMEKNSTELYSFQILGGEPLQQPEFEECLSYFENKSHPLTNWKIFSNLKHDPIKFKEKLDRVGKLVSDNKLKSFEIVCSQESWGPQAEFTRFGMNLKEWETNFNTLINNPNVIISIQSTIAPVSLPTMSEFYEKIVEWNKIRKIDYGWNTVATPSFMNPEILGHYSKPFWEKLINVFPKLDDSKQYLIGFMNQCVNHPIDPVRLKMLRNYLDRIDKRRNTNWRELYPWLNEIFEKEITPDTVVHDVDSLNVVYANKSKLL